MFSQNHEDDVFVNLLPITGTLLDIGAWHSTQLSNSRRLIQQGWSAVLVEPSPGPLRGLIQDYGSNDLVTIIGAAVGIEGGLVKMAITDDAVSTSSLAVQHAWSQTANYLGCLYVPAITIEQLWNQFNGFDFVSIDAEGLSVDLAIRYLELGGRPKAMIVEHDNRLVELMGVAQAVGYKNVHLTGENVVLAK